MGVVTQCRPDTDLAAATALMSAYDCAVLPVLTETGDLAGLVTDRDICIALVARNCRPSELTVRDVLRASPFPCRFADDIRLALVLAGATRVPQASVMTEEWLG